MSISGQSHESSSDNDLIYIQPANSHYHDGSALNALLKSHSLSSARETIFGPRQSNLPPSATNLFQNQPVQNIDQSPMQGNGKDINSHKRKSRGKFERLPSTRAKLRMAWTEERKKQQSEMTRAQFQGKSHSIERKMKIRDSLLGRKVSQATREKCRKAQTGQRKSEATKQKIRNTLLLQREEKKRLEHFVTQKSSM